MGRFIPRSEWGLPATWPARTVDRSQRTGFAHHPLKAPVVGAFVVPRREAS